VPVQLYEAVFEGAAAVILVVLAKTRPQIRRYLLMIYCASYAVFRFILEFWRGDEIRGLWGGLSTSQWISLGILAVIAFIALKRNIKAI
jgi:phosphatidylglycerol:prolipoprotein diacylglycerol transferase